MHENETSGPCLRRREWLVAAAGPALLAACGGGDPAIVPAPAPAPMAAATAYPPMADLAPGELSDAWFTYLRLSAGKSLNALQALRLTATVKGSADRSALLDRWIATQSELLAALHAFAASLDALRSGAVPSVVLAPATATTRAMVLDREGLAAMDFTLGQYLAAQLGAAAPQAAGASVPMAGIDWGGVTSLLRLGKNVTNEDYQVTRLNGNQPISNPAETALAVAGGIVALAGIALIGVAIAGAAVPAGAVAAVWVAGATVGTIAGGMGIFTGMVNAAASTMAALDAQNPADAAAQWGGAWDGVKQMGQGVLDGVAAVARPLSLAGQAFGVGNAALKKWQQMEAEAQPMQGMLQAVASSTAPGDRIVPVDISAPDLPGGDAGPTTASLGPDGQRVQTPLDRNGDGRVLAPAPVADAPGALCVNDPFTEALLAANDILAAAMQRGNRITVASSACGFAGNYTGAFSGGDNGPVSATLSAAGAVSASARSNVFGNAIAATGSVGVTGQFLAVAGTTDGGATFSGKLRSSAIGWSVSGSWSNTRSGLSGAFDIIRAAC